MTTTKKAKGPRGPAPGCVQRGGRPKGAIQKTPCFLRWTPNAKAWLEANRQSIEATANRHNLNE